MKTQLICLLTALALCASLHQAAAPSFIGTAFTYQGRLNNNTNPANGSYDLVFSLYNVSSGGSAVAGPLTNSATGITNGLFTVTLDFGSGVFSGIPYWLDISVRTNGNGAFTELSPRQQLTPVPYAIFSESAGTAATANGVAAGSVTAADIASGQLVKSLNGLEDAVTLSPGANVTITPNGNTLTIASTGSGGGGWSLTGNLNTTGSNFLGTLDNHPLELWVNGARALRLEPDVSGSGEPNVIGGSLVNTVGASYTGSTIAGGGAIGYANSVNAYFGAIGGGFQNSIQNQANEAAIGGGSGNTVQAWDSYAFIGGGKGNTIQSDFNAYFNIGGVFSTIGGGSGNTINSNTPYSAIVGGQGNTVQSGFYGGIYSFIGGGISNSTYGPGAFVGGGGYDGTTIAGNSAGFPAATVVGGLGNSAAGYYATVAGGSHNSATSYAFVGGGSGNTANGYGATIPGGSGNTADGYYSFAAGNGAQTIYNGSFVWSDFSGGTFAATAENQFSVRAYNGVRFITGPSAGVTINGQPVLTGAGGGGGPIGWGLTGNTNTDPSVNYLGTADGAGLELRVNTLRGLRLDYATESPPNSDVTDYTINVLGGSWSNAISAGVVGATIAGGGDVHSDAAAHTTIYYPNTVTGDFGTVGGGNDNTAGYGSTVPGGYGNIASGSGSFAAGRNAHTTYDGSFIWGDGSQTFSGSAANSFDVLASGGVGFHTGGSYGLSITSGGLVGINTTTPGAALEVNGPLAEVDGQGGEQAYIGGTGNGVVSVGSLNHLVTDVSFFNFSTLKPMNIKCKSITILGGSDLAEPFQISTADKEVAQGAVLVIDEENPGHLKLSNQPYDTRVAGVVSGANGINPGIQMQQQGLVEGGKNVALTGRVYVQADAANGAIKPGDLLTTSAIPGHAMRVSDHAKAQGAILGKAMTGLKEGRGMVLVLVTLQ